MATRQSSSVQFHPVRLLAFAGALMIGVLGTAAPSAVAAPTSTVNLGQASTYAVLSGASVGNTVNAAGAPHTTLRGDLGVKANAQPLGFPPGIVTGATRVGSTADPAHAALVTAYNEVAARTSGVPFGGDVAGLSFVPGLYSTAAAVSNTGTMTLNAGGDANAIFVFKIGGALTMAAAAKVVLTGGATASNVFWQVNGAAGIGASAKFTGTLMALDAVAVGAGTEVNGRALALNGAITLDSNEFYSVPPMVTITGGANAITTDTTPTISGTTDVETPGIVTVQVGGQTLTATPSAGTWSVTSAMLANATYPVTASVTDGAGNPGAAGQQLTVDTALPVVTIDGGASVTTNDPTPTISGTSDAATGTSVRVSIDGHALTALVQSDGTWNVTPAALPDGGHPVTASVTDPAGNVAESTQTLTVDTAAPTVAIGGGGSATTSDPRPTIVGTSGAAPGTTVTVTIAGQTMTTLIQADGSWSVTPGFVGEGTWEVVASAADPAGNMGTARQTLTIATPVSPEAPPETPAPPPDDTVTVPPPDVTVVIPPVTLTPPDVALPINAAAITTVRRGGKQRVRRFPLRVRTTVTAPTAGSVITRAKGAVKIRGLRRAIRLTPTTAALAAGQSMTLKLKPKGTRRTAKAAFRKIKLAVMFGKKVTTTITIRIVDTAGNTRSVRRTVRLTR